MCLMLYRGHKHYRAGCGLGFEREPIEGEEWGGGKGPRGRIDMHPNQFGAMKTTERWGVKKMKDGNPTPRKCLSAPYSRGQATVGEGDKHP